MISKKSFEYIERQYTYTILRVRKDFYRIHIKNKFFKSFEHEHQPTNSKKNNMHAKILFLWKISYIKLKMRK